jgi:hypothetical protein
MICSIHKLKPTMGRKVRGHIALSAAVVLLAVQVGCESQAPLYPVSGQVMIDGKPATTGTVRFVPKSGRPATGDIGSSGRFQLASQLIDGQQEGVLPGVYRVAVTSNEIVDAETARWLAPAKYADFRTSGLEVNVDRPLNDLAIDLTWEGATDGTESSGEDDASGGDVADGEEPASKSDPGDSAK